MEPDVEANEDSGDIGLTGRAMGRCVAGSVAADLRLEVERLRAGQAELRAHYRRHVHEKLAAQAKQSSIVKELALTSMATVVGWMTAHMSYSFISQGIEHVKGAAAVVDVIAWAVYAAVVTVLVPIGSWLLRDVPQAGSVGELWKDQVSLIRTCLPMLHAWAYKDLVSAVLKIKPESLWAAVGTAVVVTGGIIVVELCPCYARATRAIAAKGPGDTVCSRIVVSFGHLGLAVGFAWNSIANTILSDIGTSRVNAPLLVFMTHTMYFIFASAAIIFLVLWLEKDDDGEGRELACPPRRSEWEITHRVSEVSTTVCVDALHFVYAWAQLDFLNAFFFTYLMSCKSAATCSVQSNFWFAFGLTVVATQCMGVLVMTLKARRRVWNQTGSRLATRSFGLNVGWAWINFSSVAVNDAVDEERNLTRISTPWMFVLVVVFTWVFLSLMHCKFEVERRAWDRFVAQRTSRGIAGGPSEATPSPNSDTRDAGIVGGSESSEPVSSASE